MSEHDEQRAALTDLREAVLATPGTGCAAEPRFTARSGWHLYVECGIATARVFHHRAGDDDPPHFCASPCIPLGAPDDLRAAAQAVHDRIRQLKALLGAG